MPKVQCAVVSCYNGSYKLKSWRSEFCDEHYSNKGCESCVCSPPFELFPFPTEKRKPATRKVWIQHINRKDVKSRKNMAPKKFMTESFLHTSKTSSPTNNVKAPKEAVVLNMVG